MPGYVSALDAAEKKGRSTSLGNLLGVGDTRLIPARTPDSNLPLWLVDCPALYRRPGGLYADPEGRDWSDNALRFALLSHAVARLALGSAGSRWQPDLVHVNDWQLGLVPALLSAQSGVQVPCVLTIHNLAFQGIFPREVLPRLGFPQSWFTIDGLEFHGQVSFLKAGIVYADRLTTVSPRYGREILTPELGCGLDGLLRARKNDLVGILNGIDYAAWAPEDPTHVPFPFSARNLTGKHRCKAALQRELGLAVDPEALLIAFVGRLTEQKMANMLPWLASGMARRRAQLAILGEGDRSIEQTLRALTMQYAGDVAVRIGYDESLARRFLAGADVLAVPSRFEPCGLVQMYGMRYGTIPVVCRVGGLADSVIGQDDCATEFSREATGILFDEPTATAFDTAIDHACRLYREPVSWRAMQLRAMKHDFRWQRSAERYLNIYATLTSDELELSATEPPYCEQLRPTGS
jgi:starch synthase